MVNSKFNNVLWLEPNFDKDTSLGRLTNGAHSIKIKVI